MTLPLSDVATNLQTVGPRGFEIHLEGVERAQKGEDILFLSIGDPDFPTPVYITEGLVRSLQSGRTHYSPAGGEPELRDALANLESSYTNLNISSNQFVIFNGVTGAMHAVLATIANPADNVVTLEPLYLGYVPTFAVRDVSLNRVATRPPNFDVHLADILDAIDDRTVAVLINTPSNPTGRCIPEALLRQLAEECRTRNLWLITDEVYSLMYYEEPHWSLVHLMKDYENLIVIDGLSKSHAMSGWRIGWSVTNRELARHLEKSAMGIFFSAPQFVQDGAAYALKHNPPVIERMKEEYLKRRDYTMSRIESIDAFSAITPQAGMFVMVNVHSDGDIVAKQLLDEASITVFPGSALGSNCQTYVRVSLTQPIDVLEQAWDRIEAWARQRSD